VITPVVVRESRPAHYGHSLAGFAIVGLMLRLHGIVDTICNRTVSVYVFSKMYVASSKSQLL